MSPGQPDGVQVIRRAARILETVKREPGSSLSQIARRVDLPRSTVHRLVVALEEERFLVSASVKGGYRLGPAFAALGVLPDRTIDLTAHPFLVELSREIDETVDLSLLRQDRVLFVDHIDAPRRLRAVSSVGALFPAHCTANGKAMLASLPDAELERLLPATLERLTENTVTDRALLLEELHRVREQGVAYDREEHTLGISAVGAAIGPANGEIAAVSIPVPAQRFYGNESKLASSLARTCAAISAALAATADGH